MKTVVNMVMFANELLARIIRKPAPKQEKSLQPYRLQHEREEE